MLLAPVLVELVLLNVTDIGAKPCKGVAVKSAFITPPTTSNSPSTKQPFSVFVITTK